MISGFGLLDVIDYLEVVIYCYFGFAWVFWCLTTIVVWG